jgi:Enoyl-CoA hydratase/isomerase
MLAWVCDLIIASEDAFFQDPVVRMGIPGVEYFAHAFELPPRVAKEFLLLGERMSAQCAEQFGMVNRIVLREQLRTETEAVAAKLAAQPRLGAWLTKQAVNHVEELRGKNTAIDAVFHMHCFAHAQNDLTMGSSAGPAASSCALIAPMPSAANRRARKCPGHARFARASGTASTASLQTATSCCRPRCNISLPPASNGQRLGNLPDICRIRDVRPGMGRHQHIAVGKVEYLVCGGRGYRRPFESFGQHGGVHHLPQRRRFAREGEGPAKLVANRRIGTDRRDRVHRRTRRCAQQHLRAEDGESEAGFARAQPDMILV